MTARVEELFRNPSGILGEGDAGDDIAISSRIRLARNPAHRKFPVRESEAERRQFCDEVTAAAPEFGVLGSSEALVFAPEQMEKLDREVLLERYLASREFISRPQGTLLLVRPDERCSLMVNEDDALRIQSLRPGFQLDEAWKEASAFDDELGRAFEYAFDEKLGFLTASPTDGGTGMARALGYRFLDQDGLELPSGPANLIRLEKIEASGVDPRLFKTRIRVACDVTNPLLGPTGSVAVYGPQKGVTPEMAPVLEGALERLAAVWKKQGMIDSVENPGDGAAGGLGAGLRAFCKAELTSGARLIIQVSGLEKQLDGADLLITGEGCTDSQTDAGKLCGEVALTAHRHGVPVLLLSGALKGDPEEFSRTFDYAFSTSTGAHRDLAEAIRAGRRDLQFTARNLARLFKKGVR